MVVPGAQAWAEPLRLEERVAPACAAAARELAPRIERTLGGSLPDELEVSVAIDAFGAGYRLTVSLQDAAETRGTTVIEAPTCDEAVDAAAVVLALAFGTMTRSEARETPSSVPVPRQAGSTPSGPSREAASFGDRPAPRDGIPSSASERATRIALASGMDAGTLPHPTLTLGGAVTRSFGGLELALALRYGLPIAYETDENGVSESQRHDFAGLELRACRGVGHAVRVSACAGTEVGAVRAMHALEGRDGTDVDADHVAPRLSGSLAALVARRGGLIEPELELAGAAVAFGREAGAPWLVVRVAAGAAIAF
jgi:hypothetical protein